MPMLLSQLVQAGPPHEDRFSSMAAACTTSTKKRSATRLVVKEPVGVVGCITPWNYPLHQIAAKVAPALAAGCTVVLKPSEVAPLNAFILAEVVDAAGLPAGVFNLVTGTGPVVGEALAAHPDVDMVSFTGSTRAGKRVAELGGSPDDNNAFFFYDGAMSILQPMIDAGDIAVASGQSGMDKVGTLRWDGAVAQARMDNLLSANYTDKKVHGVLSPYDGLSRGIISSLKGVGYAPGAEMPIVTGQDAEVASVKAMMAGEQYSTVFKDTRELAKTTAAMVDAVMSGKEPEVNDTKTYNNGVKVIPSNLLMPFAVGKDDIQKMLVDSGLHQGRRAAVSHGRKIGPRDACGACFVSPTSEAAPQREVAPVHATHS